MAAPGELPVRRKDEFGVRLATGESLRLEPAEVGDVLGHERAPLDQRSGEDLVVRCALESPKIRIVNRDHVMATRT